MPRSVLADVRREIERARRLLARAEADGEARPSWLPPGVSFDAWMEAHPGLAEAIAALPDGPEDDRCRAVLELLAGDVVDAPIAAIAADPAALDAADAARARRLAGGGEASPLVTDRDVDPLPEPGTRADRPAVDPADALRAAADRAIQRRRTSSAPLPMEVLRVYYGDLVTALAEHAPGAAFPDRHSAPDGWGDEHRAWRSAHPMAAAALDRMLAADPHSADFAARCLDLVAVVRDGATVIDTDDF